MGVCFPDPAYRINQVRESRQIETRPILPSQSSHHRVEELFVDMGLRWLWRHRVSALLAVLLIFLLLTLLATRSLQNNR